MQQVLLLTVSGGVDLGGTASNQNDIGNSPFGPHRFDVSAINGLSGSNSTASEKMYFKLFLSFFFGQKNRQLAKQGLVVVFLTNTDVVGGTYRKDF